MKTITEMTRKDFESVPNRKHNEDIGLFDSLIIFPMREKHDSGYTCMDYISVIKNQPTYRLSGCSDVMHIQGIGGFGYDWLKKYGTCPDMVPAIAWSIDCLYKSKLLRLFPMGGKCRLKLKAGDSYSSFEIYCIEDPQPQPKKDKNL